MAHPWSKAPLAWTFLGTALLLGLAACGGGGGGSEGNGAGSATGVTSGIAVDPYIVGAVFEEASADGGRVLQAQSTPSDEQGRFAFPRALTAGSVVRMRSDARGTHAAEPFSGLLKRKVEGGSGVLVVSPLTTLLANGAKPEDVTLALAQAGLTGIAPADLTADPMAGLRDMTSGVTENRLRLLHAAMAVNALMDAAADYDVGSAEIKSPAYIALLTELATAARTVLSPQVYAQVAATVSGTAGPVTLGDVIGGAVRAQQAIVEQVRQDLVAHGGVLSPGVVDAAVEQCLPQVAAATAAFYEDRTGPAPTGEALYSGQCAACHRVGTADPSGTAPDLAGAGASAVVKLQASHQQRVLSAAEIENLAAWLDGQTPVSSGGGTGGGTGGDTGSGTGGGTGTGSGTGTGGGTGSGGGTGTDTGSTDGAALYEARCLACHKAGSHDTSGFAPDLAGQGSLAVVTIQDGHNGVSLSSTQLTALAAWLDQQTTGTGTGGTGGTGSGGGTGGGSGTGGTGGDPHATGQTWLDYKSQQFHGPAALQNIANCQACHGTDLLGGAVGISCSVCHFGPTGAQAPAGSDWVHGAIPHDAPALTDAAAVCGTCHDQNRLFGNGPTPCHDCHAEANHVVGQAWLDPKSATFHGTAAQQDIASCQVCHGSDLKGGSSKVSCSTCHFGSDGSHSPAGSGWTHGSVPHGAPEITDAVAVCASCHDRSRLYGNGPAPCHDCHTAAAHPTGQPWLDPKSAGNHGAAARAGVDSCRACHGTDLKGGSSGIGCFTCHFGPDGSQSPAGSNWAHGASPHGGQTLVNALAVCSACHAASRQYGNGPAPCHDCHTAANHPTGQTWLDEKNTAYHGAAAKANVDSCRACHGNDYRGGSSQVSCYACHFGPAGAHSPAGSNWTHGAVPHGSQALVDALPVCSACHTASRQYGNGPAPCHDCHTAVNHAAGQAWLDAKNATYHGAAARADVDSCKACHGSDYRGGSSQVSCYACHFGPAGAQAPTGSNWTHGAVPHGSQALVDALPVCSACHTASRLYQNGPAPCHDCHTAVNHAVGQAWLDAKNATYHGAAARADVDSCRACHGSDYRGGSSQVSCYACHFGPAGAQAPTGSNWAHGSIPHGSQALVDALPVCSACHATSRGYGNGPAPCHDCHTAVSHAVGQAWLDAKNATYHGTAARADVDSCRACHGSDYRGGSSQVSCYACHFGPAGAQAPTGSNWAHGSIPHGSLALVDALPVCSACHATSRSYGNGPAPCHDCHTTVSHAVGQVWLDPKSSGYHGVAARANVDSCKACHGSDYRGGSSGVSCYLCHFGPTGTQSPAGTGWSHGTVPHDSLTASEAVCASCHALERSYGNGPGGCHDCHAGASHAVPYADHQNAPNLPQACTSCHGASLQGGAGPSCTTCHTLGSPVTLPNCASCHGAPPAGTSAPDRRGAHAAHAALPEIGTSCTACHQGAGAGAAKHFNGVADVAVAATFKAETGTLTYNATAKTCGAVSCHGGQTTPAWLTGTIDVNVNAGCRACHVSGTAQYNSYASGRHSKHNGEGCVACHDTALLSPGHFTGLTTAAFEQTARSTIKASVNYTGTSCTPTCHGRENW